MIGVPLLRDGAPIGVINLQRRAVQPFTDRQIDLITTFADQAVIAIENVRLFEAEQQRTRELTEALEQQTATAEVLQVISSSPGELEPVFQAMLENAGTSARLNSESMYLHEGNESFVSSQCITPRPPGPSNGGASRSFPSGGRALWEFALTKQVASRGHKHQVLHRARSDWSPRAELAGYRTVLAVPMLKENELVGTITVYRQEVRAFIDKQIALVRPSRIKPHCHREHPSARTSCASRCNSRPPLPTYSRLSAARHSICNRCSIRLSNRRRGFAMPIKPQSLLSSTASTFAA